MIEFLYELFCEPERKVTLSDMYPEWIKLKELQTSRDTYIKRIKTDWSRFFPRRSAYCNSHRGADFYPM